VLGNFKGWITPLLKFGFPAILILQPLLAVFGFLSPWQPAASALSRYPNQTPVMVGASNRHASSGTFSSNGERFYVLFPSVLADPKVVSITDVNDAAPLVKELPGGFIYVVLWYRLYRGHVVVLVQAPRSQSHLTIRSSGPLRIGTV